MSFSCMLPDSCMNRFLFTLWFKPYSVILPLVQFVTLASFSKYDLKCMALQKNVTLCTSLITFNFNFWLIHILAQQTLQYSDEEIPCKIFIYINSYGGKDLRFTVLNRKKKKKEKQYCLSNCVQIYHSLKTFRKLLQIQNTGRLRYPAKKKVSASAVL